MAVIEQSWTRDWLDEYAAVVAYPRIRTKGLDSAIRALKRWPSLRPYWSRLRRRVIPLSIRKLPCPNRDIWCLRRVRRGRAHLKEFQRADWGWHQGLLRGRWDRAMAEKV